MFRKEAIEAKKGTPMGAVIALRPVSTSMLVMLFSALAFFIILFFIFGSYTKRVRVFGQLIPATGLVKVYAPQIGTVVEKWAREGARVTKGSLLFEISSERYDKIGTGAQQNISYRVQERLASLESERLRSIEIHREELAALQDGIKNLIRTIERFEVQIALQKSRLELARDSVARYKHLNSESYVSRDQYQEKVGNLLDQQARQQDLMQQRADAIKDLAKLESDSRALPLKHAAALAQIDRESLATAQELQESEAKRNVSIVAPESGIVSSILAERGQHIDPNRPLMNITPDGAILVADIYIKSKDIGFTRVGDRALIRYAAYPYQKFGTQKARVASMSNVAIPATEISSISGAVPGFDQNGPQELYYRATLELDSQSIVAYGANEPLSSGMTFEVDILREKRAIYEWVLEPLYSLGGRVKE